MNVFVQMMYAIFTVTCVLAVACLSALYAQLQLFVLWYCVSVLLAFDFDNFLSSSNSDYLVNNKCLQNHYTSS